MHDAAAMGGGETRDELQRNIGGAAERDGPAIDDGAQRLAFKELGDQKGHVAGADVENREDIGV